MSARAAASDEPQLVEVAQLEALIQGARGLDPAQKEYLRKRWLHQIRWWHKRAWDARTKYFRLRVTIVVGGCVLPFMTTASLGAPLEAWMRPATAVISLLVAAAAALEALYGWGAIWLEKRRAAELLKVEGWLFVHRAGRYRERPDEEAFPEFVTEVESQIAAEVGEYLAVAQSAQARPAEASRQSGVPEPPGERQLQLEHAEFS